MFVQILILILGFVLLISGANFLIKGTSKIAKRFHVSEILIGLTIVSLGTTLPELIVTIISSLTNNTNIIIGNVIGSNLCNLLLILGIVSILKPIKLEKSTLKQNLPLLILVTLIVLIMSLGLFSNNILTLSKLDGYILLSIALIYFTLPVISYIRETKNFNYKIIKNNNLKDNNINILKYIIYILLGIFALKYGGDFVVNSATNIAYILNIPERIIGLTIIALGTSLPELITSIVAIIKNDDDIAEGNIIGACTINLCLILGLGCIISNLTLTIEYIGNIILLIFSCILIWLYGLVNKNNTLTRSNGVILVTIYIIYCIKLFI